MDWWFEVAKRWVPKNMRSDGVVSAVFQATKQWASTALVSQPKGPDFSPTARISIGRQEVEAKVEPFPGVRKKPKLLGDQTLGISPGGNILRSKVVPVGPDLKGAIGCHHEANPRLRWRHDEHRQQLFGNVSALLLDATPKGNQSDSNQQKSSAIPLPSANAARRLTVASPGIHALTTEHTTRWNKFILELLLRNASINESWHFRRHQLGSRPAVRACLEDRSHPNSCVRCHVGLCQTWGAPQMVGFQTGQNLEQNMLFFQPLVDIGGKMPCA